MRRIPVAGAEPGQVLAEPVVNDRGLVVVRAGATLTQGLIDRLAGMGIWYVLVEAPGYEGIDAFEPLPVRTLYPLAAYLRGLARHVAAAEDVGEVQIDTRELMRWVDAVTDEIATLTSPFLLYWPQGEEDRWIGRTVNMAVLAARTLRRIGGVAQARHLVAASFLGQLGLLRMAAGRRALVHQARDPHAMREHVAASQAIVDGLAGVSPIVKAIVTQMYERWDGSGLPQGRKGDAIHHLAWVMAVVDEYLVSVFDSTEPLLPHEALERLMAAASFELNHAAVKAFCAAAPVYPVGMEVELAGGERGVVSGASALSSRPIVRVLTDTEGKPVTPWELNLSEAPTYMIARVIHA